MPREALEAGIETEYVRGLIEKTSLASPAPDIEHWPLPLRIHTLGPFTIVRDGAALSFPGKAQHRPLQLLQALVALGGRDVRATTLTDLLWSQETEAPNKMLDINLHRLRKLLGYDAAVILQEGKLSLNSNLCWLDLWAFQRAANKVLEGLRAGAVDGALEREVEKILRLYQGPFLDREGVESWFLPPRDRLQSRFLRVITALGQAYEKNAEWERAVNLYERGLDLDTTAEELYRRLIICHRERGERAAAVATYRRCRDMLSIILGVKPSAETDALRRQVQESG